MIVFMLLWAMIFLSLQSSTGRCVDRTCLVLVNCTFFTFESGVLRIVERWWRGSVHQVPARCGPGRAGPELNINIGKLVKNHRTVSFSQTTKVGGGGGKPWCSLKKKKTFFFFFKKIYINPKKKKKFKKKKKIFFLKKRRGGGGGG